MSFAEFQAIPTGTPGEFFAAGTAKDRASWGETLAKVRALVPPDAKDVRELVHTRCSGCGDYFCPSDKAVFGMRWTA
jgi:hypothetical protein